MSSEQALIAVVRQHLPEVQAIYLFGTWGTADERPESDLDLAVLLPPARAREAGPLAMSDLRPALASLVGRDVDLINLRLVSTVFQKEVITAGRRIYCADEAKTDEFEMVALSLYQKLNEERAGIVAEALASGRFYDL
jgi:uncharacterized protein